MSSSKIYLNVPYAQKDAAKALGAKWDAANKKWYVTDNLDTSLFAKWQPQSAGPESPATTASVEKSPVSANKPGSGVFTQPSIKDFVAYDGDEPPWD